MRALLLLCLLAVVVVASGGGEGDNDSRQSRLLLSKFILGKLTGLGNRGPGRRPAIPPRRPSRPRPPVYVINLGSGGGKRPKPVPKPHPYPYPYPYPKPRPTRPTRPTPPPFTCPAGYSKCPDIDRCYKFVSTRVVYDTAKTACLNDIPGRTRLAVPRSEAENTCIINLAPNVDRWIGYRRIGMTDMFEGEDGALMVYNNWSADPARPSAPDSGRNCVQIENTGGGFEDGDWNTEPCNAMGDIEAYVCEAP